MDVIRHELETIKKKFEESFFKYIARWGAKIVIMKNRPLENEQIN